MDTTSEVFPILYQDSDLLVINKPAGVVVNRAESVKHPTVQDWASSVILNEVKDPAKRKTLLDSSPAKPDQNDSERNFYNRAGIVHRIDKETSGCLLLAKNPQSFFALQALFKEKKVTKTYVALLHGKLVPKEGEVNAPVGRLPWNREQFGVVPGGKESITNYKVSNYYKAYKGYNVYTLVELYPETGRTHQIRVHMKYLGFPLVGDYLYAGRKLQKSDREWCPRVFLHAAKLAFAHPKEDKTIVVEAPLPEELLKVLDSLRSLEQ
jgi:23S rRNA pseudouridine1911/1915/1917 synthase